MIHFAPTADFRIEVDGQPIATVSSCTIGTIVVPCAPTTDDPYAPGTVAFGPIELEMTMTRRGMRRFHRFVDDLKPPTTAREERRQRRARRHGQRPPTRGYWVRRCACVACDLRNGRLAEARAAA